MLNKKTISPVVATALLLVVAVVAVVGFQNWYSSFQSGVLVDTEQRSNEASDSVNVEFISADGIIYITNTGTQNISMSTIKVGDTDCNLNQNLSPGVNNISIRTCLNNEGTNDVILVTQDGIIQEKIFVEELLPIPKIYNPLLPQPFDSGCIFWLDKDSTADYKNKITDSNLAKGAGISNIAPVYTHPEYSSIKVFENQNPNSGDYINSGIALNSNMDYTITTFVRNPTYESSYNSENVIGNVFLGDGKGDSLIAFFKSEQTIALGTNGASYTVETWDNTEYSEPDPFQWIKVVLINDGGNSKKIGYVNGVKKEYIMTSPQATSFNLGIFQTSRTHMSVNAFKGFLADVRIYNRILTEDEIDLYFGN